MQQVALLGLGIMGAGMARNLMQAGYPLTVWNRTAAKVDVLAKAGATAAHTLRAAVKDADLVIAMVADDGASRAIWLGDDGALAAMKPKAIGIEASTLSMNWVRELHAQAQARGLRFADAPVTGSKLPQTRAS